MKKIIALLVIVLSCGMLYGQKYSKKASYSEGLAAVYFQERWGFVDKNDKLVINYAFEDVRPFSNGVAQVKYQGKWIYIDKKGKVTSAPQIAQNTNTSKSSSSSNKSSSSSSNKSSSSSSYSNSSSSSSSKSSLSSSSYNSSSSKSSSNSSSYQTSSNSSSSSSKQDNKVKIYGKVTCDGVPVSKATVNYTPFYQGTDGSTITVKTDANGNYTLYVPRTEANPSDGYLVWCESDYGSENKYFENKTNYKKGDQHYDIALVNYNYTSSSYSSSNNKNNYSSTNSYTSTSGSSNSQNRILRKEKDGFRWYLVQESKYVYGAQDINGKELIPLSRKYDVILYSDDAPFFSVWKGEFSGACAIDGREIVAPNYGYVEYDRDSDVFVYYDFDSKKYYSLGVSLNKKGVPYMSNNGIIPSSKYYDQELLVNQMVGLALASKCLDESSKNNNSSSNNSGASSSSSNPTPPILNADNLAKGIMPVAFGYVIVKGIANLFKDSSSSSSSSGSSSGNNKATNDSEEVLSKGGVVITQKELYEHNVLTGKFDHVVLYLRNNNNHDVFVTIEMKVKGTWEKCSITYENKAATEPLNGSYADNGSKEIHLRGNSTRVVEVTSHSTRRPDAIRIASVF